MFTRGREEGTKFHTMNREGSIGRKPVLATDYERGYSTYVEIQLLCKSVAAI